MAEIKTEGYKTQYTNKTDNNNLNKAKKATKEEKFNQRALLNRASWAMAFGLLQDDHQASQN